MEFKQFIASFTGNFKDTNLILTSFTKVVTDEIDVIQRRQLEVLLRHYNFIDSLFNVFEAARKNSDFKILYNEIDKISKTFDQVQIPAQIYAHFCYATLKGIAPSFPCGEVKWIDPREFDLVSVDKISGSKSFGTGAFNETLNDFVIQYGELINVKGDREIITIPYGVNKISPTAFKGLKRIRLISIPNSVKELPPNVFSEISSLEAVFLPKTMAIIPNGAFKKCKNLKTVLATGTKEIGEYAFEETQVGSFKRFGDKNVKKIGTYAFKNCTRLQVLDLDGVSIGFGAFIGCTNLSRVSINVSGNLKSIAEVFCENVDKSAELKIGELYIGFENGIIPDNFFYKLMVKSIKFITPIKQIGIAAFGGCEKLETIEGEFDVNEIKEKAFKGCLSLTRLPVFKNVSKIGNQAFNFCSKITSLEFTGAISSIGDGAFANCAELVNLKINYTGTTLPKYCFANSPKVDVLNFVANIEVLEANSFSQLTIDKSFKFWPKLKCVKAGAFTGCISNIELLTIPENIIFEKLSLNGLKPEHIYFVSSEVKDGSGQLVVPYNLFAPTLEEYLKDQHVKFISIQRGALLPNMFQNWDTIEKVHLGKQINVIPPSCFENCTNLTFIRLDSDTAHFAKRAFYNCTKLDQIIINGKNIIESGKLDLSSVGALEENALYGCSAIKEVVARRFKPRLLAFQEFKNIERITLEVNSENSGVSFAKLFATSEEAFNKDFPNLKVVNLISNGIIPDSFFEGCINLEEINVDGEVKTINDNAFKGCENLSKLNLNFTGNELPTHCFYNCKKLTTLNMPNVNMVGESAFENCENLVNLTLAKEVKQVSSYAFKNCSALTTLPFALDANSIGDEAFSGVDKLESIILSNVDRIGTGVFANCSNLKVIKLYKVHSLSKLLFSGCTNVSGMGIEFANDYQGDVSLSELFSEDIEEYNEKYANLSTVMLKVNGQFPESFFEDNKTVKKIEITGQVSHLGDNAFKNCCNLKELVLDYIGEVIPTHCFYNCASLESSLTFANVKEIKDSAFENCRLLTDIKFLSPVKTVGDYAFKNCEQLQAVPFELCPEEFGVESFFNCKEIKELNLVGAALIKERAFYNIPSFTKIETQLINNDLPLSEVVDLEAEIEELDFLYPQVPASFFKNMTSLHKVVLVEKDARLGNNAFTNCSALTEIVNLENAEYLGNECLSYTNFESVTLSSNAKYVGLSIFKGCASLKEVTLPILKGTFGALFSSFEFEGSKEVTQIAASNEKTYYIPSGLRKITINNLNNKCAGALSNLEMEEIVFDYKITDIPHSLLRNAKAKFTFNYIEDVADIGMYAFANTDIGDIEFLGVCSVDDYAFKDCKNIKHAVFGEDLEELSPCAFEGVDLEKLEIRDNPNFVNEHGFIIDKASKEIVFIDKDFKGDVKIPDQITTIQSTLLSNRDKITSLDLNKVTVIEDGAFKNCTGLRKVIMSKNVEEIGEDIFEGVNKLDELVIAFIGRKENEPASLRYLNSEGMEIRNLKVYKGGLAHHFAENNKFGTLDLSSIKDLKLVEDTFIDSEIDELILPNGAELTSFGVFNNTKINKFTSDIPHDENFIYAKDAIYMCYNPVGVKEVKIDEKISVITPQSFMGIEHLDTVEILIKDIELKGAFSNIKIKKLILEENNLSSLGDEFNESKHSLTEFTYFGKKLPSRFLEGFIAIKDLRLDGLTHFKLNLDVKSLRLLSLLSLESIEDSLAELSYDRLVIGDKVRSIDYDAFLSIECNDFEMGANEYFIEEKGMHIDVQENTIFFTDEKCKGDIVIPDNIETIFNNAFKGRKITSLDTNKVKKIGDNAFSDIKSLKELIIRENATDFGKDVFKDSICKKLMFAKLPKGFETMYDLFGITICNNVEKVVVTDEKVYGRHYFYNCNFLKEVIISHEALEIKTLAFENCALLDNLILPISLQNIEKFAFKGCYACKEETSKGKTKLKRTQITLILKEYALSGKFTKDYDLIESGFLKKTIKANVTSVGWKETEYEL